MTDYIDQYLTKMHSITNRLTSLRDHGLTPQELLLLTGQIIVWYRGLPTKVHPDKFNALIKPDGNINGAELRSILEDVARQPDTDPIRTAFTHAVGDIRYERIDSGALRALILELQYSILVEPLDLAEHLASWWPTVAHHEALLQPEIARTVLRLTKTQTTKQVYCLGIATEIALECLRHEYMPLILAPQIPMIALLYALITGRSLSFVLGDPFGPAAGDFLESHPDAPLIFSPPFGFKSSRHDARAWRHSAFGVQMSESLALEFAHQSANRLAVVLVPNRVLTSRGAEHKLRRSLIQRGHVRAVVSFPPGLLQATSLPFSVIVLDSSRTSSDVTVCNIDNERHIETPAGMLRTRQRRFTGEAQLLKALQAPDDESFRPWCRRVPREELAENDFALAVARYLVPVSTVQSGQSSSRVVVPLGEIAEIIKPQAFRSVEQSDNASIVGEVSPGEFPVYGFLERATRWRHVDKEQRRRFEQQILRSNDVVLSTKGTIGQTAIAAPDVDGDPVAPSQSSVILRLKPSGPIQDPLVLLMCLRSPLFQSKLAALVVGIIPNVALSDLRALEIPVPDLGEQKRLRDTFEDALRVQHHIDQMTDRQGAAVKDTWTALGLVLAGEYP